jgi:hemerythrin
VGALQEDDAMAIRWTKTLSVGIPALDEQHKELFRRAGAFLDGLAGKSRQDVGILLSYLRTYAVIHFGEEEDAMRAARYPGYARHKAQHDQFIRDLLALSREQEKRRGPGVAPKSLGAWVKSWLVDHVQSTDADMADFLVARERSRRAEDR